MLLIFPWTWSPVLLSCQTRLGWVLWGWVHSGVGAHRVCVHRVDAHRVEATEMGTPRDGCSRDGANCRVWCCSPFYPHLALIY